MTEQERLDTLECEVKELRYLLTVVCANVGLCPKTGEKKNGLFTSQKEHGQRIGKIEGDLRHNVTWPGFFKGIITIAG
ncbi:MAG: hypothetical protein ACRCVN_06010, partial [Spirochaetia bacterium]